MQSDYYGEYYSIDGDRSGPDTPISGTSTPRSFQYRDEAIPLIVYSADTSRNILDRFRN